MIKNLLILPDGTEIFSGDPHKTSIQSVSFTQSVNSGDELTLGSVCAQMLEARILVSGENLQLAGGAEIEAYRVDSDGKRKKIGIFICETVKESGQRILNITAFDRVILLDRDMTQWLQSLSEWPYTVEQLADMVCRKCGLTLASQKIPNGNYPVQKFGGEGITGRAMLHWLAEISGQFARATPEGKIEFAWYRPAKMKIGPHQGENMLPYFMGSFFRQDYPVEKIQKVQIQHSASDVGTVYPDLTGETNTYRIQGNPLLTARTAQELKSIAQNLYERLKDISYVPCKVELPCDGEPDAGDMIEITAPDGHIMTAYVMKKKISGTKAALECTGSRNRSSTTVVNNQKLKTLTGRMLDLSTDVEGVDLKVTRLETDTKEEFEGVQRSIGSMNVKADSIWASVSSLETATNQKMESVNAELQQLNRTVAAQITSEQVRVEISAERKETEASFKRNTGITLDENGVTVDKSTSTTKTNMSDNGIRVTDSGQEMLRADKTGVYAKNLRATTYLIVGGRLRFQNMGEDRAGCFWIGG